MSTHNIGFYEDLAKIIFQLSSNIHLISSEVWYLNFKGGRYCILKPSTLIHPSSTLFLWGYGGSVIELRTPEREVQGWNPMAAV